jgi:hypothetical protein
VSESGEGLKQNPSKETIMATRRKYIDLPDHARRNFIKWTVGLGAALGLRPWKVFEVQESIVGPAVAASATQSPTNRMVMLHAGNGGFAWFTQLWPHMDQAMTAGRAFYATGQVTDQPMAAGDHAMKLGMAAPKWGPMSAFIGGTNETHTGRPASVFNLGNNVSLPAAVAALQMASPTLVPAIGIGQLTFGTAAGAPTLAAVPNAAGMVELFNSAASTAGGTLANPNDAALFEAYYKANLSLLKAAKRPTMTKGIMTGKVASNLLGRNLSNQLRPTAADLARYGVTAGTPAKLSNIANALITTVKAWKLNLTSFVQMPAMNDDPHGAFGNMNDLRTTVESLGKIFQAFYDDLKAEPDPVNAGLKLADSFVFSVSGDTPKNPNTPGGWPDGTPGNSNWIYVRGNGLLKAGWFGGINGNTVQTWNPTTGAQVTGGTSAAMAAPAAATVLYAVAKGDMRRVQDFYRGQDISGVTNPKLI